MYESVRSTVRFRTPVKLNIALGLQKARFIYWH
jgi:hypothetical protein